MSNRVFKHTGDLGDIVAALPSIRALGGGNIVICPQGTGQGRESLKGARFESIKPLLEAQPYIGRVEWQDTPQECTHDFSGFRVNQQYGENLLDWQGRFMGVTPSHDPWLTCIRSGKSLGRTVIARSQRYHNPGFPWHVVLHKHRNCLFVGLESEHFEFCRTVGRVEFMPTNNLLELAEVIAGANLFVGNQSCPYWVAAGLGVPIIQESWPHSPNSQVHRPNAKYLIRGPFSL